MIRAFAASQFRPMGHELLLDAPMRSVTADPARRRVTTSEWIAEHLASPGRPAGTGSPRGPRAMAVPGTPSTPRPSAA